jgi:anti-anti-sigma factor
MLPRGFLEVECERQTIILTPATNLGEFRCQELEAAKEWILQVLEDPEIKNVVIDCHATDYFGSTALALLVTLGRIVDSRSGRMVFCNVSGHALEIFKATNLLDQWLLAHSKENALELISAQLFNPSPGRNPAPSNRAHAPSCPGNAGGFPGFYSRPVPE